MHIQRLLAVSYYYITTLTVVLGLPTQPPERGDINGIKGYNEDVNSRVKRPYGEWNLDPHRGWIPRRRPNLNLSPEEYETRSRQIPKQLVNLTTKQLVIYGDCLEWKRKWYPAADLPAGDDPEHVEFKEECLKIALAAKENPDEHEEERNAGSQQQQQQQQQHDTVDKANLNPFSNTVIEGISRNLARLGVGRMDHPNTITAPGLDGKMQNLQLGVGGGSLPMRGFALP